MRLLPWVLAAVATGVAVGCTDPSGSTSTLDRFKVMTDPTPTPTATICPSPSPPPGPCKVTGGGFVYKNGEKVTFGFNAFPQPNGGLHGNIQVTDHGTGQSFHANGIAFLNCYSTCATFGGTLTSGGWFAATVCDFGEPGRADTFSFAADGYNASGPLAQGGNIQFH